MTAVRPHIRRCVVYTRKSTEDGLEQNFNSLDAQHEACEAYIRSQAGEGWKPIRTRYDDGGFSGGTMDRPALQRLLADIATCKVDIVVVYKVDRLTRSLTDFAKIVEIFERHNVSFVSVTQQFNTTTSMGRLTLNILLSFAQFEREVIGERIRDKFAASRKKGMWMGGMPPLGYDVVDRKLIVNEKEAELVHHIFKRFLQIGSATKLIRELARKGCRNKSWVTQQGKHRQGGPITKSALYRILANRVYLGEAVHKGIAYPGEHAAIVDRRTWDRVQTILIENRRTRAKRTRAQTPALLRGLIFAPTGHAMTPSHACKNGRLYRYYVSTEAIKKGYSECPVHSIPAGEVEEVVLAQVRALLRSPAIIAQTWAAVRREGENENENSERDVIEALSQFESLWDELFPAEQARIVRLLVERVDVSTDGIDVRLRAEGLRALAEELKLREAA